jgi:hypothetical protein
MTTLKEWLDDIRENGDDGTGHCDFSDETCPACQERGES